MTLLQVETFYGVAGGVFLLVAGRVVRDRAHARRWTSALFWAVLAVLFLLGKVLPAVVCGYLVLALVGLAAFGGVRGGQAGGAPEAERREEALRLRHRLFWPALVIPATAIIGSLVLDKVRWNEWRLLDPRHGTLVSLGLGALLGCGLALPITRARAGAPIAEGSRLLEAIGCVLILPQLLAALGGIFARAGVGDTIAGLVARALPADTPLVAVVAYCLGMMVFTVCLGNAFAAFPVVTLGIGLPLIVQKHGGDPAIMGSIGMLSGYCGTLMTPMAANFNLVPAMLLELRDRHAVIKAQVPIGVAIWVANVVLMYLLVYRF